MADEREAPARDELRRVKLVQALQAAKKEIVSMPEELLPHPCFGAMSQRLAAPPVEELRGHLLTEMGPDGSKRGEGDCDDSLAELLAEADRAVEAYRANMRQLARCAVCGFFDRCAALSGKGKGGGCGCGR